MGTDVEIYKFHCDLADYELETRICKLEQEGKLSALQISKFYNLNTVRYWLEVSMDSKDWELAKRLERKIDTGGILHIGDGLQ